MNTKSGYTVYHIPIGQLRTGDIINLGNGPLIITAITRYLMHFRIYTTRGGYSLDNDTELLIARRDDIGRLPG